MMPQLVPLEMMSYLRSFSFTNTLWEPRIAYIYCWCSHRNFHLLYETDDCSLCF